jgi:hypothetical protein
MVIEIKKNELLTKSNLTTDLLPFFFFLIPQSMRSKQLTDFFRLSDQNKMK